MESHKQEMGKRIQEARKKAGFRSARELAERLGVRRETVSAYEAGMYEVPVESLRKISQLTGMPVSWFYGESVEISTHTVTRQSAENAPEQATPTPPPNVTQQRQEAPAPKQEPPPWAVTLLDAVTALAPAAEAPPWAGSLASDFATREDTHAVERAILRLADEVRELRLVLLSGGKASASVEGAELAASDRPSPAPESETSPRASRPRRSIARRVGEAKRLNEQRGAPKDAEEALARAREIAGVADEPSPGMLHRQEAGDRKRGAAG